MGRDLRPNPVGNALSSEEESLDGQEQPRTCTTRQETVSQASGVALYAQAASDTTTTETVRPRGIGAGPRLQEGDQEAREEAVTITGLIQEAELLWASERSLQRLVDQEKIGQQGPKVDRRVQVVDQL